jgi:nucleotide-binding universal stress UspA family protein
MFKSILVPTDGSERARHAIRAAVEFARAEHAMIVGLYPLRLHDIRPRIGTPYLDGTPEGLVREAEENRRQDAERALHYLADASRHAGVPCETHIRHTRELPHDAIVREAERDQCDLIFMASDVARGFAGWFAPSAAAKVILNSKIPVMLYRQ